MSKKDIFFERESSELADDSIENSLKSHLEDGNFGATEAGIARQLLADGIPAGLKNLSEKQAFVFKRMMKSLVEHCAIPGCNRAAHSGKSYCPICDVEYGEGGY